MDRGTNAVKEEDIPLRLPTQEKCEPTRCWNESHAAGSEARLPLYGAAPTVQTRIHGPRAVDRFFSGAMATIPFLRTRPLLRGPDAAATGSMPDEPKDF